MKPEETKLYTTAQAAKEAGVTRQTVANQINAGIIPAKVTVHGWRIREEDVAKIVRRKPGRKRNDPAP